MKILFTGKDDFNYNRVRVLLAGLKERSDVEVEFFPITKRKNFDKKKFIELQKEVDFIYIPPFRHHDVKFIKKLSTKPVVFDPLISKYSTKVIDYGHFWKAPIKYLLDKVAFSNSDYLIADTLEHKKYFAKKFKINSNKIGVVPVGVDTSLFYPTSKNKKNLFKVGFYGSLIPLQGVKTILKTARLLKDNKDIEFDIIGKGRQYKEVKEYVEKHHLFNVNLLGWVNYDKLNEFINEFDICLGIFGESLKADSVIPNKVFHYVALSKCVISKDTPAIRELFTPRKNIILTPNKPEEIAKQILEMKNDVNLRDTIGSNAKEFVTENYNHVQIASIFINLLKKYSLNN
ncbi:glycosyltransferase [Polaribacter sp.]|nr:glycosyltransferase [Polaribacter sp.]